MLFVCNNEKNNAEKKKKKKSPVVLYCIHSKLTTNVSYSRTAHPAEPASSTVTYRSDMQITRRIQKSRKLASKPLHL